MPGDTPQEILTAIQKLNEAVEELMAAKHAAYGDGDYPVMHSWIVSWEQIKSIKDGQHLAHKIDYAMSQGCSMSGCMGLTQAVQDLLKRDLVWDTEDDED